MRPSPSSPAHGRSRIARLYVFGGILGLSSAFVLLLEKIQLLKDPSFVPSCDISPILNCGSIMRTHQAEVFGFPNPIIGVAAFAVITTIGVALRAGASFRPWFWWGLGLGALAGVLFVHWLVFQSLYRIGALCPYCMVVWTVTIPIFWYTALHLIARSPGSAAGFRRFVADYHGAILTLWYLVIVTLIARRFWTYWSTLLT